MAAPAATPTPDWAALERTVRGWLGRRAPSGATDDLTQEVLLRVHRTLPAGVRSADAWALRTAHSVLVDHLRAASRRPDAATDPAVLAALAPLSAGDAADRPDAGLDAEADRALDAAVAHCLGRAVERLPAEQRDAVLAVADGRHTQAQAAAAAGVSVPGMKSRVQRGREAARAASASCCRIDQDGRGRPIAITPVGDEPCPCGCHSH